MAEDLIENLANYRLQLQQVEAALTTDTENDDLIKLQSDLQEIISLTEALIGNAASTSSLPSDADESESVRTWLQSDWQSGDKCLAPWSKDQQYYVATVDEILNDGTCSVIFERYGSTEVTQLSLLKPVDEEEGEEDGTSRRPKTKKDLTLAQREYKKKKSQKKAQRLKQMEDEREQDKQKWVSFNAKVFSKTTKGKVKKSIFASPDSTSGRVGVGTCGVSGKPMTKFTHMEKHVKKT